MLALRLIIKIESSSKTKEITSLKVDWVETIRLSHEPRELLIEY